jgi:release factor glutamine methyltransferase
MLSVLEVVKKTSEFFASKGVESPRLDAELVVSHVLGIPRMGLYMGFEAPVADADLAAIRELVRRRGKREPLQYVLGFTEFHGLRLKTDRRALIPRPETEYLVETVIGRMGAPPARILDLGTGSGAIALALAAAYPEAAVTAADSSAEALALASENARATGLSGRVEFVLTDWFAMLPGPPAFDLIISNPPYLAHAEVEAAAPEVRDHEPRSALASGDEGFSDLARIVAGAAGHLAPGAMLALETGPGQHARAEAAARSAGFARTESCRDLAGRDRFFLAWR